VTLYPFDLKIALPVTLDAGNISLKSERFMLFRFRVNGGHGTDRRTDGQTDRRTHNT